MELKQTQVLRNILYMYTLFAFAVSYIPAGMHVCHIEFPSTAFLLRAYVSTRMNACIRAVQRTFGLWAADPFAGVNMCMRACRHGQSTPVMTPASLPISGFSSSSPSVDFDKQNRKCLLG